VYIKYFFYKYKRLQIFRNNIITNHKRCFLKVLTIMSSSDNLLLYVKNVSKDYYKDGKVFHILNNVNLQLEKGRSISIMGPSGSGKTTLLNIIGTLDRPTSGEVFIDNKNITTMSENALASIRLWDIGFVFQFYNLVPVMTALENVMLPMQIAGIDKEKRLQRAQELLERVNLQERMDHYPNELSGGEQQRVAIARALANKPKIILADEPTADLDPSTAKVIMDLLIKETKYEGGSLVVVTHDPKIGKMMDEMYLISDIQKRKEK